MTARLTGSLHTFLCILDLLFGRSLLRFVLQLGPLFDMFLVRLVTDRTVIGPVVTFMTTGSTGHVQLLVSWTSFGFMTLFRTPVAKLRVLERPGLNTAT
jgi:hypothetical protein